MRTKSSIEDLYGSTEYKCRQLLWHCLAACRLTRQKYSKNVFKDMVSCITICRNIMLLKRKIDHQVDRLGFRRTKKD